MPKKIKLVDGATGGITEIDEEAHMVGSIAAALEYVGAATLNPIQVMWCNVAGYVAPRLGTLGRWWKNRKAEKMADMRKARATAPAEPQNGEYYTAAEHRKARANAPEQKSEPDAA